MGRGPKEKEEGKRGREKELVSVIDSDESKHHGTNLAKTRDFTAGNRHENSQGAKTCLPSSFAKKFILSDEQTPKGMTKIPFIRSRNGRINLRGYRARVSSFFLFHFIWTCQRLGFFLLLLPFRGNPIIFPMAIPTSSYFLPSFFPSWKVWKQEKGRRTNSSGWTKDLCRRTQNYPSHCRCRMSFDGHPLFF